MKHLAHTQPEIKLIQNFINLKESAHTKRVYSNALSKFLRHTRKPLNLTTDQDAIEFVNHLKRCNYSSATIRVNIEAISSLYAYLSNSGETSKNPFKMIKKPRPNSASHSTLSSDEVKKLFSLNISPRDNYILSCLFYLGLRASEIVAIKHSDFFINNGALMLKILGKGKKERTVRISDYHWASMNAYLSTLKEKSEFVLRNENRTANRMVSIDSIQKRISEISKLSGIKFSAHSGRYTIATNLVESNIPISDISILLGHSSIRVTEGYIEKLKSTRETSASMMISY